mgnify:CR=1 FL=1
MSFHGLLAAVAALTLTAFLPAQAADPVYTGTFSDLAVQGHDPVAYFTKGAPVAGDGAFETEYMGAIWRLESAGNRDLFVADPAAYAPQYGGYCAWAIAQGKLAKGDARFWTIHDGRLYLNYDQKVQDQWLVAIPGFIEQANANWPGILD